VAGGCIVGWKGMEWIMRSRAKATLTPEAYHYYENGLGVSLGGMLLGGVLGQLAAVKIWGR